MTIADLLSILGGAQVVAHKSDSVLEALAVAGPSGNQLILVQRTYREGLAVLLDPTDAEIDVIRSGDLWELWNSGRTAMVDSLGPLTA